jgi:tRNA(Ile)-lysidine synthase
LRQLDGEALKKTDGSLEENAREARYKALAEIANYPLVIVTAHHAGDQAETMYMRLRRGTTLAGLRGIQEVRATIYRPFLAVTRAELLAYAQENHLKWVEDESNADTQYARNKIRHQLLPHLEKTCPGATKQLCRISELADRVYGKVLQECENVFGKVILDGGSESAMTIQDESAMTIQDGATLTPRDKAAMTQSISLDKKKLRKALMAHENADLSEMFRLWLSEKGLRFPIGFFYDAKEPARVKIPHHAVYRRRAIVKIGHTVQICEFSTPEEALNFVSCEKKDKGL